MWILHLWNTLEQIFEAKVTTRLKDSPAIISSHESGALRRMMKLVEQQNTGETQPLPKQKIEVNPKCVAPVELCSVLLPGLGSGCITVHRQCCCGNPHCNARST